MKSGAAQLRDWMRRRGFNKTETAAFFDMKLSFFSLLVNGKRNPGLAGAIAIERLTGIPVEAWLLSDVDESPRRSSGSASNSLVDKA